jgi:hypothetical protein
VKTNFIGCACGPSISGNAPDLIGCSNIGCVVGAEELATPSTGIWVKTRFWQEGPWLKATVYSVAAGEPKVFELAVDLRPIAKAMLELHTKAHAKASLRHNGRTAPKVGWSLGKMWKKAKSAAKAIGRSKLVKGVVKVTKSIAKSKIVGGILAVASVVPITAPFAAPALGAYAAAHAAVKAVDKGRKAVSVATRAAGTVAQGKKLAASLTQRKAQTAAAVKTAGALMTPQNKANVAARVRAAANVKLTAQGRSRVSAAITALPTKAARAAAASKVASQLDAVKKLKASQALAQALPPTARAAVVNTTRLEVQAAPLLKTAAATAQALAKPQVKAQLTSAVAQGQKAQALLADIQKRAQGGSLDAQKSAAIVNLVARNTQRQQAMAQASAGGLPGILITPQGKLVRGRFRVQAKSGQGGLLYQGPASGHDRGTFAKIAGAVSSLVGDLGIFHNPSHFDSFAINGDLPIDGVRVFAPGANAGDLGVYENERNSVGCNGDSKCAPCAARA